MSRREAAAEPPAAEPLTDEDFAELFEAYADLPRDASPILLAVSGGPDSTVLMHAIALWAATTSAAAPPACVATVDHGLRPEAAGEAAAVGRAATALDLPHATLA